MGTTGATSSPVQFTADQAWLVKGQWSDKGPVPLEQGRAGTMAHAVLTAHNRKSSTENGFAIAFDALTSHDITFVNIIQTAMASGLKRFPLPYVLTNCHNSLCAVGGTINEDDHVFGLSAAKKFGGVFVPPNVAVMHQFMREMYAGCGKMILGSDSHTRYGALGALSIGEGGPELVKQLLGKTYDIAPPKVIAVHLAGAPGPGVGPMDVSLALIAEVFASGFAKNAILEFVGPGIASLSVDYRMGIDVMTTETTCLSSLWQTDEAVRQWLAAHGREGDYTAMQPAEAACYDGRITIDLSAVEPMIALPFHPSNALPIRRFLSNPAPLLEDVAEKAFALNKKSGSQEALAARLLSKIQKGGFMVDQCIVAGCAGGTHENCVRVSQLYEKNGTDTPAELCLYPASLPVAHDISRRGDTANLLARGVTIKSSFCGPCFGAGDIPSNAGFSIRHTTRNFPHREGSKPGEGQVAYVALMDARSIAATAINGGKLTPATDLAFLPEERGETPGFDPALYARRVYNGWQTPEADHALVVGPGIAFWPEMPQLPENLLLSVACAIDDPVTTTDELIPSGETSSFRSNPFRLSEFTLSRKAPEYVGKAKALLAMEKARQDSNTAAHASLADLFNRAGLAGKEAAYAVGSLVVAVKPGDGSAREQAASCQKVLGGWGNIAREYATKRYRSNLINWGLFPFILAEGEMPENDDLLILENVRNQVLGGAENLPATLVSAKGKREILLSLPLMTAEERTIMAAGCLMNYYAAELAGK